jgi:uncharacterized protein YbjQ (UPF0145 family)
VSISGQLGGPPPTPVDIRAELRRAVDTLHDPQPSKVHSMTSDLSIDEELILHSVGWEPIELVCGVSLYSVPMGVWNWGQGEITSASAAYARAFEGAIDRIHRECAKAGGHGVVGVQVDRSIHRHHVDVTLLGTAVRPVGAKRVDAAHVFVSDLSARDFTLLHVSGWQPLGLAVGASFVYAPRRSIGVAMQQKSQNVELTNFTEAMYAARESAMERMQSSAIAMGGNGGGGGKGHRGTDGLCPARRRLRGLGHSCPSSHREPSSAQAVDGGSPGRSHERVRGHRAARELGIRLTDRDSKGRCARSTGCRPSNGAGPGRRHRQTTRRDRPPVVPAPVVPPPRVDRAGPVGPWLRSARGGHPSRRYPGSAWMVEPAW